MSAFRYGREFRRANPPARSVRGSRRSRTQLRGLLGEALESRTLLAFDVWTGAVNGNWSNPGNWSLLKVPGTGDTAEFSGGATTATVDTTFTIGALEVDSSWNGTLNVNNPLSVSGDLDLAAGTLNVNAAMSIGGSMSQWTGGVISIASDVYLTNEGTLDLASTSEESLRGAGTLSNQGTIDQTTSAYLTIDDSSTLDNTIAGTLDFEADATITNDSYHSVGTLTNEGLIEKTLPAGQTQDTGATVIGVNFDNSGTGQLDVQAGTFTLDSAGGTNTGGTFNVATGATLNLTDNNTINYVGTYTGTGGGTVSLNDGTFNVGSAGVAFNFPSSLFQWTGGVINTSSGNVTNDGTINLAGGSRGEESLRGGGTFTNDGTIDQTGTGYITLDDNSTLDNTSQGTLDFQGDGTVTNDGYHSVGNLTNEGLIEKTLPPGASSDNGTTYIQSNFDNSASGQIDVQAGTLALQSAGGTNTGGTLDVATGATLDLTDNNTVNYVGAYTGSGGGTVSLNGGTFQVGSAGVTLSFPGALFQWSGGIIDTSKGNVINAGTINLAATGGGEESIRGDGTLTNDGTINQVGNGDFTIDDGSTLDNSSTGTLNFAADATITNDGYHSTGNLTNEGLIEKTLPAGQTQDTGATVINVNFDNSASGQIDVQSGTVTLDSQGGTNAGGAFDVAPGATLNLTAGGTVNYVGTYTATGSGTISLNSGTFQVGSAGATLDFPGSMFQWSGGVIETNNGNVVNTGTINLAATGNGEESLRGGGTITNDGTINQVGDGDFTIDDGSTLDNPAGSTINFEADATITNDGYHSTGSIINAGLIDKSVTTGDTLIQSQFDNSGQIDVQSGTITLDTAGGLNTGGTFTVAQGATLDLTGGTTVEYSGTYTGTGAGTILFQSGSISAQPNSQTSVLTFDFTGASFQWTGGVLNMGAADVVNEGTINLAATGNGEESLRNGGTLSNDGIINQTGSGIFTIDDGSTLDNTAQGTFDFAFDATLAVDGYHSPGNLTNEGLIEKTLPAGQTQDTGSTIINVNFDNNGGEIDVQAGTITLDSTGGTNAGGTFDVATGATLNLTDGNTVNYVGTYTASGGGTVSLNSGAFQVGSAGVTLDFAGALFQWAGGVIETNTGNVVNTGTINLTGGGEQSIRGGGTVTNDGTINLTGTGSFTIDDGSLLSNASSGVIDLESDSGIGVDGYHSSGSIANAGTFEKTATTGSGTTITVGFSNTGTVKALAGTLSIPDAGLVSNGSLGSGTWDVGASSTLSLNGTITSLGAAVTLEGAGATLSTLTSLRTIAATGDLTLRNGASLSPSGSLTNSGEISLSSGELNVAGTYGQGASAILAIGVGGLVPGIGYGQLNVSQTATLNGTLSISLLDGYVPTQGDSYTIVTAAPFAGSFLSEQGLYFGAGQGFSPTFTTSSNPQTLALDVISESAGTNTSLSSSSTNDTSSYGASVTFTATVTPQVSTNLVPGGTIEFFDGNTELYSTTLVNGSATYTTSALAGGLHSIVAQYLGDINFSGSNSQVLDQTVNPVNSSTSLQPSENPSTYGDSVMFTATVAPATPAGGLATPTGTVEFYVGATLEYTTTLDNGSATYTTSGLAIGANLNIEADYLGDNNYNPSNLTIQQTVNAPPPATIEGEVYNDPYDTGSATGNSGLDDWTVNLMSGSTQIATTTTNSQGGYVFSNVFPGPYTVVVPELSGYVATSPSSGSLSVNAGAGQTVSSVNFGEFQTITVAGEVFDDAGDTGAYSPSDSGLTGWTVDLTSTSGGLVQQATTVTGGGYSFSNVGPGTYTISQVPQAGYIQTDPASGGLSITPVGGENIPGENLGVVLGPVLSVNNLSVSPSTGLTSGSSVTLSWDDVNSGGIPANASFTDDVTVTNETTGQVLGTAGVSYTESTRGPLAVGGSAAQQYVFQLPDGAAGVGQIEFTVTADVYDSVSNGLAASGRTSSTSVSTTLANYADLIVAPSSLAVNPASPQSGQTIEATWMDENQGDAAVDTAFQDYVLVQQVGQGGSLSDITSGYVAGDSTLGVGQTSPLQSFSFTLPNGSAGTGDIRVTVTTDAGQIVKEYDGQGNPAYGNNSASTDVTATLAPTPDLVVQNIVANGGSTAQVLPGQTISVTWDDVNEGSVTAAGSWTDQVFLASNAAGTANLQLLGSVSVSATIAPSGSAGQSANITIPATDEGDEYVVVETALSSSFYENNTTNATTVAATPLSIPPSLAVSLAAPGNSMFDKDVANPASSATVTRNDTSVGSLNVTISSSNASAVLLSATPGSTPAASVIVTIPNGSFSAVFYVDAVQDGVVDGTQTSSISPSSAGYLSIPATATELETNTPTLSLTLASGTFADNSGTTATLSRNTSSASALDSALTVAITSSDPSVATAPTTVTIPANQSSVTFAITGVATSLLVDSRSVIFTTSTPVDPVTGLSFAAAAATATVTDTNTPTLELSTSAPYVEDNAANPAAYATLSLTNGQGSPLALASAITVALKSNDPSDLAIPATVTVPAGSTSVQIPLTVIDNPNNDNPVVTLSAYALDAVTDEPISTGHATTTLSVLSTSGPTLSISAPSFIATAAGTAQGTVSLGSTPLAENLTINLSSSDSADATVPVSVVILAGATSAPFPITIPAGATAGPVTISGSSSGWNMGVATSSVVTTALPDLTVTSIKPPASLQAGEFDVPITWTVANDGNSTASGSWNDVVVLSTDPQGQDIISTQTIAYSGGPLAAGSSYTGSADINLPGDVGTYYVTVTTNRGSSPIAEITTSNDSLVAPVSVGAAYNASLQVAAGESEIAVGSPLTLSGTLAGIGGGTPGAGVVYIAVYQNGQSIEEDGPVFANPSGAFSYTFEQSASDPADHFLTAGDYTFYALTNGQSASQVSPGAIATATVLGLSVAPSPISLTLVPGTPDSGTVTLTNESSVPLTNLVVTSVNEGSGSQTLPISVALAIHDASLLPGTTTTPGQLTATYTLTATQSIAVSGDIYVTIDDDQGVPVTLEFETTIAPPTPDLTATTLNAGVVVATQTLATFTLTNIGSASSGPITVVSPLDWITIASQPAPLGAGQSEQVEVTLSPAQDATLGPITGTLGVDYESTGLAVNFSIDVVSNQQGTLDAVVDDETTTATENGTHLAGATVQLINPLTSQPVAMATTSTSGVVLPEVTAGTYELEVTAPGHSTYTSPITIQPGANSVDVFLNQETVTYTWTVVPTTIADNYTIQLQADFVTQVPIPNLVPDKAFVMPLIGEGGSAEFVENVTNEGLIAATNVQISGVSNGTFTLTPLVTSIPVLPAQSEYPIPVELTAKPGVTVQDYLDSTDCCNLPQLDIDYSYTAAEPVEQIRQVTVDPVFVTTSHYAAIENAWGANSPSFSSLSGDLFNSPDAQFIQLVLADSANSTATNIQGQLIGSDLPTLESELLSALANGLTGTASQVAADASDLLSGICNLTNNPTPTPTGTSGIGGTGGGITGGTVGTTTITPTYTPYTWSIPTTPTVTAQVRLEIDQDAVLTRDAFQGTLTIDNTATTGLSDIQVQLDIETVPGPNGTAQEATDDFFVESPQLSGFTSNTDGSFDLAGAGATGESQGTASYTIIPTLNAAPTAATEYSVGGTLTYTEAGGTVINVPLLPAQITVEPSPDLVLNYFWQQQVEGQDAVTPAVVQPSVPFDLGVQVTNIGYGAANNFSITTAQPQIIENQSGLLVGFTILGTTVNGQAATPSLTADFGDIEPGQTATAAFILESTLAGYFENFTATYEHSNALGGEDTSLIDSVSIHNLVEMVEVGYVGNPATVPQTGATNPVPNDGVQDFLTSDLPGSLGQPDTLYLSNGTSEPVATASDVNVSEVNADTYQVTAYMPQGWGYFDIADPTGGNLDVSQVARPDGLDLLVGNDVWNTVQNITSNGVVTAVNDLHLLDYNTTAGYITYTITYTNPNAITPEIEQLEAVKPATVNTAVGALDVTFNEPINLSTFTAANLSLTLDGQPVALSGVTIALVSGSTYQISGLAPLTSDDGDYVLTVSAAGVQDSLGDQGAGSLATSWTMDTGATVVSVTDVAPALRNTSVTDIEVDFSSPIEASTFTLADLDLSLDGGDNLITPGSGVTITNVVGGEYDVSLPSALTAANGSYVFTVTPTGVIDQNGNAVAGGDFTDWTMDTTPPSIVSIEQPQTPRNIVVPTLTVTFSEPINLATFTASSLSLTRTVNGVSTGNLLSSVAGITITPDTTYLAPPNTYVISGINLPQYTGGTYTLTISNQSIADDAGNLLTASGSVSWVMDLSAPAAPSNLAISPDLGPNPNDGGASELTNSQTVTFSGAIDANTVEVRLQDVTTSTYLGDAFLNGLTFSRTLTLPPGLNELSAQAFDAAGNGSIVSDYTLFVDIVPPAITSMAPIAPTTTTTPVNTETVVLTKNVATFGVSALGLTMNGNPVALTSGVTVTPVSGASVPTYLISGLAPYTDMAGSYVLTVNASQIVDDAGNSGTGTASVSWTQLQSIAALSIGNSVNTATTREGGEVTFTVTVTDNGPENATGVSVLDPLPAGLTLVSASGSGGYNTSTGVWTISQIANGSSATLSLVASVNQGTIDQTLSDVATITALDEYNPNSANNSATASTSVRMAPTQAVIVGSTPRNTAVSSVQVTFSDPVQTGALAAGAVTLTDNGSPVAVSGLSLAAVSGDTYQINGLNTFTGAQGSYSLTVNGSSIPDLAGLDGIGSATAAWLMDTTPPTATVASLPQTGTSLSFPITVSGTDPVAANGGAPSGIAYFSIYVSVNGGAWTPWAGEQMVAPTSVSGNTASATVTYTGVSSTSYAFYATATDKAGNTTAYRPAAQASTILPDLAGPTTSVNSPTASTSPSTVNSAGTFTLNLTGTASGGEPLTYFEVFVGVDLGGPGANTQEIASIPAGFPNASGVYQASITYQGLTDGQSHSYQFWSLGIDGAGHVQSVATPITFTNKTFAEPSSLQVTGLTVEDGAAERSYIRYLSINFNESNTQSNGELATLSQNLGSDIQLIKFTTQGAPIATQPAGLLSGVTASVVDDAIELDFGVSGIGGTPTTTVSDGWYELEVKIGATTYTQKFYRLLGDVNGDGIVNSTDLNDIATEMTLSAQSGMAPLSADVTGQGTVTAVDQTLATRAKNDSVASNPTL